MSVPERVARAFRLLGDVPENVEQIPEGCFSVACCDESHRQPVELKLASIPEGKLQYFVHFGVCPQCGNGHYWEDPTGHPMRATQ